MLTALVALRTDASTTTARTWPLPARYSVADGTTTSTSRAWFQNSRRTTSRAVVAQATTWKGSVQRTALPGRRAGRTVAPPGGDGATVGRSGLNQGFLAPQSWLMRTWFGLPRKRWTLICGNRLWAGLPWMIIANGWVKSVVEPLTIGKGAVMGPGESALSTIHTVVPGVLHGCRVRPSFWNAVVARAEHRPVG